MEATDISADLQEKIKDLPEDKQKMVTKLYEKVNELKELQKEEEGWKEAINKDGYTVFTKKTDSGLNCVRGHGPIDFSAEALVKYINTPGNSLKYDQQFKEGKEIEKTTIHEWENYGWEKSNWYWK